MAKRRTKTAPVYAHERTSFAGISERLALASLWKSKTWLSRHGYYMHVARLISKNKGEGWEAHVIWTDDSKRINKDDPAVRRHLAEGIEGARANWYSNQHPSKELLAIVANVAAKKAA